MSWIHTGGGWYENTATGRRVRGKANISESPIDVAIDNDDTKKIVCMACHKVTVHTPRPSDSTEWASYTCSECEGKTRVRLF